MFGKLSEGLYRYLRKVFGETSRFSEYMAASKKQGRVSRKGAPMLTANLMCNWAIEGRKFKQMLKTVQSC